MSKTFRAYPHSINKTIQAPASKSIMQRIIAGAVLADKETIILQPSFCDDCKAALGIARSLGCEIIREDNKIRIIPKKKNVKDTIHCGESGLAVRMFSPIIALLGKDFLINGEASLLNRPIKGVEEALKQGGVQCVSNAGYLPLQISGSLKGGIYHIDGSMSSQVLTGLLTALPYAAENSTIYVDNLKSIPYINLTISILKKFGIDIRHENYRVFHIKGNRHYTGQTFSIEGDWSGAAFLLAAGLIAGKTEVCGLNTESKQADIGIIEAIKKAGGSIIVKEDKIICEKSDLKAFEFDASHCPDLFPPLAVMAAYCKGKSRIYGVSRLKHKESNRAETLVQAFSKIGVRIAVKDDCMLIEGGKVQGGTVCSHNDHRIAMAAATAALSSEKEIIIKDAQCINKSYPEFYTALF